MNYSNRVFLIGLILFVSHSALSQQSIPARVIEVVDGKTVVIELQTGKVTVVLQHIDVPEREQELHQVVLDHLKQLVLGRVGDFRPRGITRTNTVGQLVVGGIDISEQMLRDGAAWLTPYVNTDQEPPEREEYRRAESNARSEKRGVWGVKDLQPSWEFRFAKEEKQRREEELYWEQFSRVIKPGAAAAPRNRGNTTPGNNNVGGFISKYDAATRTGKIETPVLPINDLKGLGRKVACSLAYVYQEEDNKNRKGTFFYYVAFVDMPRLGDNLVIMVDGQKVAVAKGRLDKQTAGISVVESLVFEMSRNTVEKIANGGEVGLRIGNEVITPAPGFQMLIYNLLDASK
jgi:endonuclease YncB( thermonuclease family)